MILRDPKIWLGEYEIASSLVSVGMPWKRRAVGGTTFGAATEVNNAGLSSNAFALGGIVELGTGSIEEILDQKKFVDLAVSVAPGPSVAEGDFGQFVQGMALEISPAGKIGDNYGVIANGQGTGGYNSARGRVMGIGAKTATGTSAAYQDGAIASYQRLIAALHVTAVSGGTPNLVVTIESDDNAGFSSPTTQLTFTAATAKTSEVKVASGPITDTYWRAKWTISGSTPSFTIGLLVGKAFKG